MALDIAKIRNVGFIGHGGSGRLPSWRRFYTQPAR